MNLPTLSWMSQLLPASWRGIPFVVEQSSFTTGRKLAIHEYPYKDTPLAEDMGLGNQTLTFNGFLTGDTCFIQRDLLAAACQTKGSGILIHPSLTYIPEATLISAVFNERVDRGRVVEVQLSFLVTDDIPVLKLFGMIPFGSGTFAIIATAVTTLVSASRPAFSALLNPASLVLGLVGTTIAGVTSFASRILSIGNEPSAIFNSLNGLQSLTDSSFTLSRYNSNGITPGRLASISTTLSPTDRIMAASTALLDNVTTQRATISTAVNSAIGLASTDPSNTYLDGIYSISEALRTSINDPQDQIRLLITVALFQPDTSMMDLATRSIANATASACRKGVLMSLALAAANYQPTNSTEAMAILSLIVPLFDAEILYAADANDISTYQALIALRSSVVNDLQSRALQLPELFTFTEKTNLPILTLAYKIYQDTTREAELVQRIDPIHPLFCIR